VCARRQSPSFVVALDAGSYSMVVEESTFFGT
jgi:hypothetical protein